MPPDANDLEKVCTLAQIDLFFEPKPEPHPKYTREEAKQPCADATEKDNPCGGSIKP